jgi:hypothetical protein
MRSPNYDASKWEVLMELEIDLKYDPKLTPKKFLIQNEFSYDYYKLVKEFLNDPNEDQLMMIG